MKALPPSMGDARAFVGAGMQESESSAGPTLALFLYVAVCSALTVFAFMGIPWTEQSLGALVFVTGFPLLWLNERRASRMTMLHLKALQEATVADPGLVESAREGKLLFLVGPLHAAIGNDGEQGNARGSSSSSADFRHDSNTKGNQLVARGLALPKWGVEAPPTSAAVCARVESYRPVRAGLCSCAGERGYWAEGGSEVPSLEERAQEVRIGQMRLGDTQFMDQLEMWAPFSPPLSERLVEIIDGQEDRWEEELQDYGAPTARSALDCCPCCTAPMTAIARRFLANPYPFPGERPYVDPGNSVLYYPRGGGNPKTPMPGDIRVSFVHIPANPTHVFTAFGVQRMGALEPFRYRAPPPKGLEHGRSRSEDFNLGTYGDEPSVPFFEDERGSLIARGKAQAGGRREEDPCPGFGLISVLLTVALEGWRRILHQKAPERLLFVTPGNHTRLSFFIKADWKEFLLTWRIRILGFLVMVAGVEIAFFKWEAWLALVPFLGAAFSNALWAVAIVGAAGFTLLTMAAASIIYRPLSALLFLGIAGALFAHLLGYLTLLMAAGSVGLCMALLAAIMLIHLVLPC
mmetsp:Transcript_31583/g.71182  ORF Transcript_31583/g.71182 Transcript_31583/m.71182 type:complete len:577 (+) Transcript_31583:93-1823(+)